MKISAALVAVLCYVSIGTQPAHASQNRFDATVPRAQQIRLATSAAPADISGRSGSMGTFPYLADPGKPYAMMIVVPRRQL